MKSVSVLFLVCAFACASAQFGVKGGASDSSGGPLSGSFYPRFNPVQATKGRVASSNNFYGPSVYVSDDGYTTSRMNGQRGSYFPVTRTFQSSSNEFLYGNRQPGQYVQYDASPVLTSYPTYMRSTYNQPQVTTFQRGPSFTSTGYGSFGSVTGGNRQFTSPTVVSTGYNVPSVSSYPRATISTSTPSVSENVFTDNKISSPGFSTIQSPVTTRYSVPTVTSYPSVSTTYSSPASTGYSYPSVSTGYASSPVSTRYSYPSYSSYQSPVTFNTPAVSGNLFTDNKISSPGFTINPPQERVRYSSIPSVPSAPSVSTGYTVPKVSLTQVPSVTSLQAQNVVANAPSGEIFTDNKISSGGLSTTIRTESPIIRQEKQFADVVQTTEW